MPGLAALAKTLHDKQLYVESARLQRIILTSRLRLHPKTESVLEATEGLGLSLQAAGRLDEAEAALRQAATLANEFYGVGDMRTARPLVLHALVLEAEDSISGGSKF